VEAGGERLGNRLSEATALGYLSSLPGIAWSTQTRSPGTGLGTASSSSGRHEPGDRDPRRNALPFMQRLRERFEETVNPATRHDNAIVVIG
jgi:DNA-binding IclR family transcriptional regulator